VRTKPGSGRLARPICGALSGEVAAFYVLDALERRLEDSQ